MTRSARKECESGVYHVMLRGINQQNIFECDEDYVRFLKAVAAVRKFLTSSYLVMQIDTDDEFLDVEALAENPEDALRRKLEKLCGIRTVAQFQALPVKERNRNIRILRDAKLSIRQISRMTGIPFGIVRSK